MERPDPVCSRAIKKAVSSIVRAIKPYIRTIVAVVAVYVTGGIAGAFLGGYISSGGDLKQGLIAAVTAGIGGISAIKGLTTVGKAVAHGAIGGLSAAASGGNFKDGFLSGAFGASAGGLGSTGTIGGNILRDSVVGGVGSVIGGGKFKNGARSAAFASAVRGAGKNGGIKTFAKKAGDFLKSALKTSLDVVGKLWTLPNTILGTAYGLSGYVVGNVAKVFGLVGARPTISFGNNAIQFQNNPLIRDREALTIGNTISYGNKISPSQFGAYGDPTVNVGLHEREHTFQYQKYGPLFFPAYLISGGFSGPGGNGFEREAQDAGRIK